MKKKLIAVFCILVSLLLIGFNTKSNTVTNTKIPGEDTSEVLDLVKDTEPNKEDVKKEKSQDTKDFEVKKEDKSNKSTEQKATQSPSVDKSTNNDQSSKPASTPPVTKPSNDPKPEKKQEQPKQEQNKQENTKQPTPTPSAKPSNEDLIKQLEGEKKVETICIAATTGYPTEEAAYAAAIQEIANYEATHNSSTGSCGAQQHFDDFGHVYWTYWVSYN